MSGSVDFKVADPLDIVFDARENRLAFDTLDDVLDARNDFARVERFRDVIVGVEFEADDAIDRIVARRHHQDRDVGDLANRLEDFDAGHRRQIEIEQDDIEWIGERRSQRLGTVQADRSSSRKFAGTGLGLCISKRSPS